jgi:[ribosomal protein S5]-alanine N-acetyltransferase
MQILFRNIALKPWSLDYAVRLAEIANNKKIADNLRDGLPHPYTTEDAINWLNMTIPVNDPPRFFAIFYDWELAGSIGLVTKEDIYRKNMEIGYFLAEEYWGKGIMTDAILSATTYAFRFFDIVRLYAEAFADNKGSRRALEKAGYTCEALIRKNIIKNGIVQDSTIYSVLKEDFKGCEIVIYP